jgi:hypothetical protein
MTTIIKQTGVAMFVSNLDELQFTKKFWKLKQTQETFYFRMILKIFGKYLTKINKIASHLLRKNFFPDNQVENGTAISGRWSRKKIRHPKTTNTTSIVYQTKKTTPTQQYRPFDRPQTNEAIPREGRRGTKSCWSWGEGISIRLFSSKA